MTSILITGGFGDFLAIDAHVSEHERAQVREVWLATRAASQIRDLIKALPNWHVEDFRVVERDYTHPVHEKKEVPEVPARVADWSIGVRFAEILQGRRRHHGGSIYKATLAGTGHNAPVVIHPATTADKKHPRRLDADEWRQILDYLNATGQRAAVVGNEDVPVPQGPLTNLLGKTGLLEAVEIVKQAEVYLGVDSWASVVAAQDTGKRLAVKSDNLHLYRHQAIYYAPRADFGFVRSKLTGRLL